MPLTAVCQENEQFRLEVGVSKTQNILLLPSPHVTAARESKNFADISLVSSYLSSNEPTTSNGKRSRLPDKSKWKQNKRKTARDSGFEYSTAKGKTMKAKLPKEFICTSNCKCSNEFTEEDRLLINKEYWSLADYGKQRLFLKEAIQFHQCVRKLTRNSRRKFTYKYRLRDKIVCKGFFLSTLNISDSALSVLKQKVVVEKKAVIGDRRGQQQNALKLPDAALDLIREHIKSFPTVEAHYVRKSSSRLYMASDLNISKLYALFVEKYNDTNIKEHTYRRIFTKEFNISFHTPKKDACNFCHKYRNAEDRSNLEHRYAEHQLNKELVRETQRIDKQMAKENPESVRMYTFDLQPVLYTPCSNVSSFYYTRKFASYNCTLYDMASGNGFCYFWKETDGRRGSDEIGSCLLMHLKTLPETVRHIILYSDGCGGQNRNRYIAALLLYAIKHFHFECIEMKFLESDHTQMEVDSMHSVIEKAKKGLSIYSPDEWPTIFTAARRTQPYDVTTMMYSDFIDMKHIYSSLGCPLNIRWLKVKQLRVSKENTNLLQFKTNYNEEEFSFIETSKKRRRQNTADLADCVLQNKYNQPLPIAELKKKDLLSLCESLLIPRRYSEFYRVLPTNALSVLRLEEPNFDESDDESILC